MRAIQAVYDAAAEQGMTVDHIYPLQHPRMCGLHVPWNLQLLSLEENSRKKNQLPDDVRYKRVLMGDNGDNVEG